MKVILPDYSEVYLPGNTPYQERLKKVNDILDEHEKTLIECWDLNKTRTCLSILADYLCRSPEFKQSKEYPTLGVGRQARLDKGDSRCIPFSTLPVRWQSMLGLVDISEEDK